MLPAMEQTVVGLKSCTECAAQMPDFAAFCPGCGRSVQTEPIAPEKVGPWRDSFAGALAYVTFLPAIILLLVEPYRRNSFVRFHAVQCLLFWLAGVAVAVTVRIITLLVSLIPDVGPLLAMLVAVIVTLAAVLIWFVLFVKAFQGERFSLPLIGDLAEHYSDHA